jgi:hypothetical protein
MHCSSPAPDCRPRARQACSANARASGDSSEIEVIELGTAGSAISVGSGVRNRDAAPSARQLAPKEL